MGSGQTNRPPNSPVSPSNTSALRYRRDRRPAPINTVTPLPAGLAGMRYHSRCERHWSETPILIAQRDQSLALSRTPSFGNLEHAPSIAPCVNLLSPAKAEGKAKMADVPHVLERLFKLLSRSYQEITSKNHFFFWLHRKEKRKFMRDEKYHKIVKRGWPINK